MTKMLRSSLILAVFGFSMSHPIVEVIDLIAELKQTAKKDQEEADISYEKSTHEFQVEKEDLENKIASSKATHEEKTALMQAKADEADALTDEIGELEKRMDANTENESAITTARGDENGVYLGTKETMEGTITALEDCLKELQGGTALLAASQGRMQAMADAFLPASEQHVVSTFLAKLPEDPKARVYDSKTGSVKDLFVKLIRKFKDKLSTKEKQELRALNAHDLSVLALKNEHKSMTELSGQKKERLGKAETTRDEAKKAAGEAKTSFDQYTLDLSDKERTYRDLTNEYNLVTKERQEEDKAMDIAVDILKSIAGVRGEHEKLDFEKDAGPVPATVFLQLAGLTGTLPREGVEKVVNLLRTAGGKLHSAQLEELAMKIGASKGPFNQINNLIQRLIDRLVTEQQKEDNHKAWCDNEWDVTTAGKDDKDTKLQVINADMDTAATKQTENESDKKTALQDISDFQKQKATETEERRLQKNNNKVTLDDAKKAQRGLQQAILVLKEWNEKKGEKAKPTEQNGKVIELLNNAETSYVKMEGDIEIAETTQEDDYRKSMASIKKSVAMLEAQVEGHNSNLQRLSQKFSTLGQKKKHTKNALFELNQYLDDLTPACRGGDYEKRKADREAESKALKEAQTFLKDAFKDLPKPELMSVKKHIF